MLVEDKFFFFSFSSYYLLFEQLRYKKKNLAYSASYVFSTSEEND